jgi:hypothetical protein
MPCRSAASRRHGPRDLFNIAVPIGTAPDSVSEEVLLASETSNGFAVWNASVGDWEYIRAASVVDNMDGTWTLSTLLRGLKGHRVRHGRPCRRREGLSISTTRR